MKKVRSEDKKKKTSMVAGEVKREARKRRYWNWEGVTQARASKATAALSFLLCAYHDLQITGTRTRPFKGDLLAEGAETFQ